MFDAPYPRISIKEIIKTEEYLMKKKFISLLTALSMTLMLFMCMPISVSADVVGSGSCGADGDNVTWSLDSSGILAISGSGDMKDFDSWNKAPWIESSDTVATNITSVIIESGVTNIGKCAFIGCTELASAKIPNTVRSINECAFMGCSALKLERLPESVEVIGKQAFQQCVSLETMEMPGVIKIENDAFQECSTGGVNDPDITLCTGLKAVYMPKVTDIGG